VAVISGPGTGTQAGGLGGIGQPTKGGGKFEGTSSGNASPAYTIANTRIGEDTLR